MNRKAAFCMLMVAGWISSQQNAQSENGAGKPPQSSFEPLPVQNYAVIDLGGPPDPSNITRVAMDDEHNVGIAYDNSSTLGGPFGAQIIVQTFKNGVLSPRKSYAEWITNPSYPDFYYDIYSFSGVRPNGQLIGEHNSTHVDLQGGAACVFDDGSATDYVVPFPYAHPESVSGPASFSDNNLCCGGAYYAIVNPDGTFMLQTSRICFMQSGSKQIIFDPLAPAQLLDTPTTHYERQHFSGNEVNDAGSALSNDTNMLWDGATQQLVPVSEGAFCLNEQTWCLVRDGGIWHAGNEKMFTDLLPGNPNKYKLTQVRPQVLSNRNQTDGSMYAITSLQDNGNLEKVVWKATSPNFLTAGLAGDLVWQPYQMQLPDGVEIRDYTSEVDGMTVHDYGFEVISTSGVIAAIGNSGNGNNHALLLLPFQLTQTNYPTSKNNYDDGNSTTRFIQSGNDAGSVAYVNGVPAMPKLQAQVADGNLAGLNIVWRMTATSDRSVRGAMDDISIPVPPTKPVTLPSNQAWMISDYMVSPADFFGGKCIIYYTIQSASGIAITPEQKFNFLIRGKNPMDDNAKTYILANESNYFYAWAIAQHESRTPSGKIYNQFATANGSSWGDLGQPFYAPSEGHGWGMFQRDDTDGGLHVDVRQIYSWKVNTQVAVQELDEKWSNVDRILRYFRNRYGNTPGWEEPPQQYTISHSQFSAWDLATMVLYNHVTGCPRSIVTNDSGGSVTVTFPWKFNPNGRPKWQFYDNDLRYATHVVTDEWEHGLPQNE